VELPRTIIPIASATSLSEYDAVDIDMDLVFAELPWSVLHSEVFCFGSEVEVTAQRPQTQMCFRPLGVRMCVQALASAGAFQAAPSNLIGPEARYQITLGKGLSAAASIFCLGERGTKGTESPRARDHGSMGVRGEKGAAGAAGGTSSTARTTAPARMEITLASSASWASMSPGLGLS
jgi:hypothetical protein